jgi:hypothetical protein
MNTPELRKSRWGFCVLTGCLSVFFAEVALGSYPSAYTSIWGWVGVFPVYALHILLLLSVAFSRGVPSLRTLYSLGAVFGLYEAYLTKMLWVHTWGDFQLQFAGVSWFAVIALVFYWHPLMAFILPAFTAELLLTSTPPNRSIIPAAWRARFVSPRSKTRLALLVGVLLGLNQAGQAQMPFVSLRGFPDALLLAAAVWWWQSRGARGSLAEFLPSRKACFWLAAGLIAHFMLIGGGLRVEVFPGAAGQSTILALYGFFAWMAWRGLQSPVACVEVEPLEAEPAFKAKHFAYLVLACFGTSAATQTLLPTVRAPLFAAFLLAGMLGGIVLVAVNLFKALRRRRVHAPPAIRP